MRDAIEMREFADHGHQWSQWVGSLFHRLHAWLHWAGAAFATDGFRRAG